VGVLLIIPGICTAGSKTRTYPSGSGDYQGKSVQQGNSTKYYNKQGSPVEWAQGEEWLILVRGLGLGVKKGIRASPCYFEALGQSTNRFLDIGYQCSVRFYFLVRNIIIRTTVLFIPNEVLTPQFKEPVMNHPVIMILNGSYMPKYILIPYLLRSVADIL
jgi:hypothetical protein